MTTDNKTHDVSYQNFDLCNMLVEQHRTRITDTPRYVLFETMMTTSFSKLKAEAANANFPEKNHQF